MEIELYFKCRRCGYIFYKDTKEFVKDNEIQKFLKHTYSIDTNTCESCINYEKWERGQYFT